MLTKKTIKKLYKYLQTFEEGKCIKEKKQTLLSLKINVNTTSTNNKKKNERKKHKI